MLEGLVIWKAIFSPVQFLCVILMKLVKKENNNLETESAGIPQLLDEY